MLSLNKINIYDRSCLDHFATISSEWRRCPAKDYHPDPEIIKAIFGETALLPYEDRGWNTREWECDTCGTKLTDPKSFAKRTCQKCEDQGDEIFSTSPLRLFT